MNKNEKLIVLALGLILVWWFWDSFSNQKKVAEAQAKQAAQAQVVKDSKDNKDLQDAKGLQVVKDDAKDLKDKKEVKENKPRAPEQLVVLTNGQVELTFSSHGAVITKAKMLKYAMRPGKISDENPPVVFDLAANPALALGGVEGLGLDADYAVAEKTGDMVDRAGFREYYEQ